MSPAASNPHGQQPFPWAQALRCSACQGQAVGNFLTASARRFADTVSQGDNVSALLRADEVLSFALSQALRWELEQLNAFFPPCQSPSCQRRPK